MNECMYVLHGVYCVHMWPSPGGNAQLYKVYWTVFESMIERSELGKGYTFCFVRSKVQESNIGALESTSSFTSNIL